MLLHATFKFVSVFLDGDELWEWFYDENMQLNCWMLSLDRNGLETLSLPILNEPSLDSFFYFVKYSVCLYFLFTKLIFTGISWLVGSSSQVVRNGVIVIFL